MADKKPNTAISEQFIALLLALPWLDILAEVYRLLHSLWRGLADEGMYEVLEHESTLEILDRQGKRARFEKRQKVRYLQNNIISYFGREKSISACFFPRPSKSSGYNLWVKLHSE